MPNGAVEFRSVAAMAGRLATPLGGELQAVVTPITGERHDTANERAPAAPRSQAQAGRKSRPTQPPALSELEEGGRSSAAIAYCCHAPKSPSPARRRSRSITAGSAVQPMRSPCLSRPAPVTCSELYIDGRPTYTCSDLAEEGSSPKLAQRRGRDVQQSPQPQREPR